MPHQCVRCSSLYGDGAKEILDGCTCGCKMFFFIKKSKFEALQNKQNQVTLTPEQKVQMETDIFEIVGVDPDSEYPVVLDFESIQMSEPGKYELDLVHLFRKDPVVVKVGEGKYIIDLAQTFEQYKN